MLVTNEQELIVYFAKIAEPARFEILNVSGSKYPDSLISWRGREYRTEFEYNLSSFKKHGHDPELADLIICWIDDWPACPLPVLCLRDANWLDHLKLEFAIKEIIRIKEELRFYRVFYFLFWLMTLAFVVFLTLALQ